MKFSYERLNDITGGDDEMIKELLGLYNKTIDKVSGRIKAIDFTNKAEAKKQWHDALHELKGAAGNIGIMQVFDFCMANENASPDEELAHQTITKLESFKV